nr:hypothetical protein [uncultured Lichenicoccus sp.]
MRIPEAVAARSKHLVGRNTHFVDDDFVVATRHGAIVALCHHDADRHTVGAGDELLASVDDSVIAVQRALRFHHRGIGPGTVILGRFRHEECRAGVSLHPEA